MDRGNGDPHCTMPRRYAEVRRRRFPDDLMFGDTTVYEYVIVFDIHDRQDRMRLVSRGTVAGFGQFSSEEDDARPYKASRQGNKFSAL